MTQKEFILNLDTLVKKWRINYNLFCGGCCFSAGQIAKILEDKGIRYQVICWHTGNLFTISFKTIVKKIKCNHVAIKVSIDGKNLIIGGTVKYREPVNKRTYYFMNSKTLITSDMIGAELETWNHVYNRDLNDKFINELNILTSKYNF